METVLRIAASCLIGVILSAVLRKTVPEISVVLVLAVAAWALISVAEPIRDVAALLNTLEEKSGIAKELFSPLYKAVGITLVVRLGCAVCADAGESALAAVLSAAGAFCALLVSIPLIRTVIAMITELL